MKKLWILGAVALIGSGIVGIMQATAAPADSVKYRQAVMRGVGASMGNISAILKGDVAHGANHIRANAEAMQQYAGLTRDAFRENTGATGPTKAKPNTWTAWADFETKSRNFEAEVNKLVELSRGPSPNIVAIGDQMKALGGTCGACHREYRE